MVEQQTGGEVSQNRLFLCDINPYAGPLDLLIYLVKEKRVSIEEVRLSEIADQYLAFMEQMGDHIDLELLGSYMLVSATLVHIKSRMLVPSTAAEEEIDDVVDLKQQMLVRLAESLMFKQASEGLERRRQLYRDEFPRPAYQGELTQTQLVWIKPTLYDLVEAFRTARVRMQQRIPPIATQPTRSLAQHVKYMVRRLAVWLKLGNKVTLQDLDTELASDRVGKIFSFLGLLQLVKNGGIHAHQDSICAPIVLSAGAHWDEATLDSLVAGVEE